MNKERKLPRLFRKIGLRLAHPSSWMENIGQMLSSAVMEINFCRKLFLMRQCHLLANIYKRLDAARLHIDYLKNENRDNDKQELQLPRIEQTNETVLKPKIGYVIPGTGIAGGVAVVCEHVNRLLLRGYDVSIISEDNLDAIPWFPNQLVPVLPLRQIAGESYGIIVATGWTTAYTAQQITADRKFYFVQSDESRFYSPKSFSSKAAKKTYEMDFEFITMARWLQDWLKDDFGKNSIYVPNGINEQIIFPSSPIQNKGNMIRILLEGSINIPFKGMEDAFLAVEGLDCQVWCVSSYGKPKPEWKCDKFFEKVPFDKMRHIYSSCDILLKMSRVESFSYPPLEMMACGGTAVVGDVTGIDEYIVDGYNALVVGQGDTQGAHNAIKTLIENESLRNRLTANGKKTAEAFRWDPSIDILENIFLSDQ